MNDAYERFLDEWAATSLHAGRPFVRDGVIDPPRWSHAPKKVLFLLKEAYGEKNTPDSWDLRGLIREGWRGPKFKIWHMAACWADAVHRFSNGRVPEFPTAPEELAAASEALLASAAINIKKSGGQSSSNDHDLATYVLADRDYIRRQIELINPDVIVSGNVWDLVRSLWPDAKRIHERVWSVDGRPLFALAHPANQYPNWINYYAFAGLLQNSGLMPDAKCPANTR